MERELWAVISESLKRLPRRRLRNAVYHNAEILAVLLWAALHDRPISWACKRSSWPVQAWKRRLPDQSTVSRRLRHPSLSEDLGWVLARVQSRLPAGRVLLTDGKAYPLEQRTGDRQARVGRGPGRYAPGYKLHVLVDEQQRLEGWEVEPMNTAETTVCKRLVSALGPQRRGRLLVGDAGYDSNPLHEITRENNLRLLAPRRRPGTGLGERRHHRDRLASKRLTEERGGWMWEMLKTMRWGVERFFAGLASSAVNAGHLPMWVRGLTRVRLWIGAKLTVNAARLVRNERIRA